MKKYRVLSNSMGAAAVGYNLKTTLTQWSRVSVPLGRNTGKVLSGGQLTLDRGRVCSKRNGHWAN